VPLCHRPSTQGVTLEQLVQQALSCRGPVAAGTSPEPVRLHDDLTTYTGVYARGGPSTDDRRWDISQLLDRCGGGRPACLGRAMAAAWQRGRQAGAACSRACRRSGQLLDSEAGAAGCWEGQPQR
jgi:hypothetical protein